MEKDGKKCPKVIVTGIDAWRDDVGANTLPNFFSGWDVDSISLVYTKSDLPDTNVANRFFQISENEILHAMFHIGQKVGKEVRNETEYQEKNIIHNSVSDVLEEHKRYNFFRNHRLNIFYLIREMVWSFGAWKSKALDDFILNSDADVLFLPVYPYAYMNNIQTYIAKKTGLRGVAYIADDNYSYRPEWYNPLFLVRRFFLRKSVRNLMKHADELLVILPKLQEEYKNIFRIPTDILTKGIDESKVFHTSVIQLPIKMIYTGNLFIGRDKTLINVVKAIKRLNDEYKKSVIQLDIYSHIHLSNKLKKKLEICGSSKFKGAVPISAIDGIQREADVVLFVEGMDFFNRNKARLSFSTKLTDYFKAGKCIFAVGPEKIAPMEYLSDNEAAVTATSAEEIYEELKFLVNNPSNIHKYAKKAYELGISKHSEKVMKNVLFSALERVANMNNKGEQ